MLEIPLGSLKLGKSRDWRLRNLWREVIGVRDLEDALYATRHGPFYGVTRVRLLDTTAAARLFSEMTLNELPSIVFGIFKPYLCRLRR